MKLVIKRAFGGTGLTKEEQKEWDYFERHLIHIAGHVFQLKLRFYTSCSQVHVMNPLDLGDWFILKFSQYKSQKTYSYVLIGSMQRKINEN